MKFKSILIIVMFLLSLNLVNGANFSVWLQFDATGTTTAVGTTDGNSGTRCMVGYINSSISTASANKIMINITREDATGQFRTNFTICESAGEGTSITNCVADTVANFTFNGSRDIILGDFDANYISDNNLTYDFDSNKNYMIRNCFESDGSLDHLVRFSHADSNKRFGIESLGGKTIDQTNWDTDLDIHRIFNFWNLIGESDTGPPNATLLNLTSEGGLGQIIFEIDVSDNKQEPSIIVRTNDTTPTIHMNTTTASTCAIVNHNRDLNYTDAIAYNPSSECSTTGSTHHICTLTNDNATARTGLHNFSIGCKATSNNENTTSTSGKFLINITDPVPPKVDLSFPLDDIFFVININTTAIDFNWTSTDNVDMNYTCNGEIDGTQVYTNSTYENGTEGRFNSTVNIAGSHVWNITCTDSYNNINTSGRSFDVIKEANITLFLDGVNDSRKYEYPITRNNIVIPRTVNITIKIDDEVRTCITIDDEINVSCNIGNWSYYLNVTELKRTKLFNGTSFVNMTTGITNVSMVSDNTSDIIHFTFNFTGYEDPSADSPSNISVTINGVDKYEVVLRGQLQRKRLTTTDFIADNQYKNVFNITFSAGGSVTILVNASSIKDLDNLTFDLSGFDLDKENEFTKLEQFNSSDGSIGINNTLTFHGDASMGFLDDFVSNNSRWSLTKITGICDLTYVATGLDFRCGNTLIADLVYNDPAGDLRNSSRFEILTIVNKQAGGVDTMGIKVTDGTSSVTIATNTGSGNFLDVYNITMTKVSDDFKIWNCVDNVTSEHLCNGNTDLSSLDFTKQISLKFFISDNNVFTIRNIRQSGGWLNRSTNNGTYKSLANITSKVVQLTETNVSRATLTAGDYVPAETNIDYFLSNTCNATKPTFEPVGSGVAHVFNTVGNSICWRATLNSSSNITSPVVRKVKIEVVGTSAENVSVDFGSDGDTDWTFIGTLNSTASPKFVNGSMADFITYRTNNCLNTFTCQYPITLTAISGATLQISNVNSTIHNIDNININISKIVNQSKINITVSFLNGILELSQIDLNFKGNQNFTINATHSVNSTLLKKTVSLLAQFFYSKINDTLPYTFTRTIIPLPRTFNDTNISPFGQSDTVPIVNISGKRVQNSFDIGLRLTEINSCLEVRALNSSNTSLIGEFGINLTNVTKTYVGNVSGQDHVDTWLFYDFYNCNASIARFLRPKLEIESCVVNATRCWSG